MVGVGRDPALIAYCKPDLIITSNRVSLAEEIPMIALNDFVEGNPYLAMYDTDLMQACQNQLIEQASPESLAQFSEVIYQTIHLQAKDKQVLINPYYNAYTKGFRDQNFIILGPKDEIAYQYSRKVVAYQLGQQSNVPVPQGAIVHGTEGIKKFLRSQPKVTAGIFVASDNDPFYPVNLHIKNLTEIDQLKDGINYLVTTWMNRTNSPNSQVLIGKEEIVYLDLLDQIIKHDVKYYGNTFPSRSHFGAMIKEYSLTLAQAMQKDGYRGIVGFDWIETKDAVYLAEINPRKNRSTSMLINCLNHFRDSASPELIELEITASTEKALPSFTSTIPDQFRWRMELYKIKTLATVIKEIKPKHSESKLFEQPQLVASILNFPATKTKLNANVPDIARIIMCSNSGESLSSESAINTIESALKF